MDLHKKKVLLIPLEDVLTDGGDVTEFTINKAILDKIRTLNMSRVVIITDKYDGDFRVKVKAIEFFVFAYLQTAVSTITRGEDIIEEIFATVTHGLRKTDYYLSVGEEVDDVDFISKEDFLCSR